MRLYLGICYKFKTCVLVYTQARMVRRRVRAAFTALPPSKRFLSILYPVIPLVQHAVTSCRSLIETAYSFSAYYYYYYYFEGMDDVVVSVTHATRGMFATEYASRRRSATVDYLIGRASSSRRTAFACVQFNILYDDDNAYDRFILTILRPVCSI